MKKLDKTKAMRSIMCELDKGRRFGEEDGYVTAADIRAHFRNRLN